MEQKKIIDQWTGAELQPGFPELCQGNGEHPDFEICCDNCRYFLECFPEWKPGGSAWGNEGEDTEPEKEVWLRVCAFKCLRCGDVLKREYKSPNDYGGGMMTCSCGHLTLDPTPLYWRVSGNEAEVENLCEVAEEPAQE